MVKHYSTMLPCWKLDCPGSGVNLAMAVGGWWVENRERPPPPP